MLFVMIAGGLGQRTFCTGCSTLLKSRLQEGRARRQKHYYCFALRMLCLRDVAL